MEAVSAQVVSVAKEALEQLHRRMCMQQATQEDAKPGDEANVLRTLIKLTTGASHPRQHSCHLTCWVIEAMPSPWQHVGGTGANCHRYHSADAMRLPVSKEQWLSSQTQLRIGMR